MDRGTRQSCCRRGRHRLHSVDKRDGQRPDRRVSRPPRRPRNVREPAAWPRSSQRSARRSRSTWPSGAAGSPRRRQLAGRPGRSTGSNDRHHKPDKGSRRRRRGTSNNLWCVRQVALEHSAAGRAGGDPAAPGGHVLRVRRPHLRGDHRPSAASQVRLSGRRPQRARRPANARAIVSSSAYSRSEPAGSPCAGREIVTACIASCSAT
jgi:hypothetical protein